MTNREWLNSLSDEEMAELLFFSNDFCNQYNLPCPSGTKCSSYCINKWLGEEYKDD